MDPRTEYAIAIASKADRWVPACRGVEPVSVIEGRRLQYCFNPATGRHAYYDLDQDLILEGEMQAMLPKCLRGG